MSGPEPSNIVARARRGRPGPPEPRSARILVVEDSPSARRLLQAILTRLGVDLPHLRIASTAHEALRIFTEWRPQIAFVDLDLQPPSDRPPAVQGPPAGIPPDGSALVRRFLESDPDVRVIVCTAADPSLSPIGPLVRAGRIEAIVKPVRAATVEELLGRSGPTPDGPSTSEGPGA